MRDLILLILAVATWSTGAALLCFWLSPAMLVSGHPAFILLAFIAPPAWLVIGLLAWIALADATWARQLPTDDRDDLISTAPSPAAFRATTSYA